MPATSAPASDVSTSFSIIPMFLRADIIVKAVMILLLATLLTGFGVPYVLPVAVWILAVLTWVTVAQRILHVRRQLRDAAPPEVAA